MVEQPIFSFRLWLLQSICKMTVKNKLKLKYIKSRELLEILAVDLMGLLDT